jgi:hypothetical protein
MIIEEKACARVRLVGNSLDIFNRKTILLLICTLLESRVVYGIFMAKTD